MSRVPQSGFRARRVKGRGNPRRDGRIKLGICISSIVWVDPSGGDHRRLPRFRPGVSGSPRGRGRRDMGVVWRLAWGWIPAGAGRRHVLGIVGAGRGWIPAGAGETPQIVACRPSCRVDPRGGGGDPPAAPKPSAAMGGSPRGRGRRRHRLPPRDGGGWIPAGAGETRRPAAYRARPGVDPRGGGGDRQEFLRCTSATGGSPRGRGRLEIVEEALAGSGWIPAGAGETRPSRERPAPSRVDPRGGGGDTSVNVRLPPDQGGSPRGRGRRREDADGRLRAGWIPAGAGETRSRTAIRRPWRVDPRGGGGDTGGADATKSELGGSPRGRGRRPGRA